MARITAIEVQKKSPQRVNLYLDGEFAFGLAHIVAAWLHVGQELSTEKIAELQTEDTREQAYQQAMLFLSYRARSESEIRQNLRKHKIPTQVIEDTLDRLRKDRLADDGQFAQAWVENRNTFRPRSRRALSMELRQKGINDEGIQTALAGINEESLAYDAARRRANRFEDLEWIEFRKKLSGFLTRRGFSYSIITSIVTRIWNETHAQTVHFENEDMT